MAHGGTLMVLRHIQWHKHQGGVWGNMSYATHMQGTVHTDSILAPHRRRFCGVRGMVQPVPGCNPAFPQLWKFTWLNVPVLAGVPLCASATIDPLLA